MEIENQSLPETQAESRSTQPQTALEFTGSEENEKSEGSNKAQTKSQSKVQSKTLKEIGFKVIFEGEAAEKLLWLEGQLKERSAKPDMGQILGKEILNLEDQKWVAIIEENTEMDYFFSQIRRIKDKPKALKLLKGLSEKLLKENEGSLDDNSISLSPSVVDGVLLANNKASRKKSSKSDEPMSEMN